jgi:hypothetical protein
LSQIPSLCLDLDQYGIYGGRSGQERPAHLVSSRLHANGWSFADQLERTLWERDGYLGFFCGTHLNGYLADLTDGHILPDRKGNES